MIWIPAPNQREPEEALLVAAIERSVQARYRQFAFVLVGTCVMCESTSRLTAAGKCAVCSDADRWAVGNRAACDAFHRGRWGEPE